MKSIVERCLYADTENIMRVFSFCVIASGEMVVEMFTNSIRVIYSVDFNSEESVSVKGLNFRQYMKGRLLVSLGFCHLKFNSLWSKNICVEIIHSTDHVKYAP